MILVCRIKKIVPVLADRSDESLILRVISNDTFQSLTQQIDKKIQDHKKLGLVIPPEFGSPSKKLPQKKGRKYASHFFTTVLALSVAFIVRREICTEFSISLSYIFQYFPL